MRLQYIPCEARQRLCAKCIERNVFKLPDGGEELVRKHECKRGLHPYDSEGNDCPYFRTKEYYQK